MASIRINTVSNGPTIIGLNAGSTYELGGNTNYENTVILEKDSAGATISTITIKKYVAEDSQVNWDKLNEAAYKCIASSPKDFGYPTFANFTDEDYRDLDLSEPLADIIAGAMGNDLPAVYSEWLAWVVNDKASDILDNEIDEAKARGEEAATACSDATSNCPTSGYYFDPITGSQCDCNSASGCCASIGSLVESSLIADAVEATGMTKKHIYLFDSVVISGGE